MGRGFLQTTEPEPVLECILEDPRWDPQIDERGSYYAQLLVKTNAPLDLLQERLSDPELPKSLPIEVLAEAAWRGYGIAGELLAGFLHDPQLLPQIRSAVYETGGRDLVARVLGPAHLGWIDETRPVHVPEPTPAPNQSTKELLPRLEQPAQHKAVAHLDRNAPLAELLEYREQAGAQGFRKVMRILGRRGYEGLLEEAVEALQREELAQLWRQGYLDYLEELPDPVTRPLALQWLRDERLLRAALFVLRKRAQPQDLPALLLTGHKLLKTDDCRGVTLVVEAVTRLRQPEAFNFLAEAYAEMPYSYGRALVVKALSVLPARAETRQLLVESLWDCEPVTRELAAAYSWQPDRLRQLAADPFERAEVRAAAEATLLRGAPTSLN